VRAASMILMWGIRGGIKEIEMNDEDEDD